ncbi:MAG: FAD-linked oxidase C-terminal domain-containing protein [Pseudomonadota bacterium]
MTIDAAITELGTVLGNRLSRSKSDLALHGQSETYYPPTPPDAVIYPETTAEVQQIVRICAAARCPIIPWGVGTSLEGHALALHGGICVDFSRMNRIVAINQGDMDAVVQPGVTREALNQALRATGLFFSVDPGANATLGGMAMTRASGTTSVRYGTMRDAVLGFEAVLADGEVINTGTRARKSASGYDLTALLVGSEGTLALVTQIALKLQAQPSSVAAALCTFPDVGAAVDAAATAIQMGLPLARIELVDAAAAAAVNAYSGADFDAAPHLILEFHGSETGVAEDAAHLREIVDDFNGSAFRWSRAPEERSALWAIRHNAHYACLASRPGARTMVTDICVPISKLAQAVDETRADIDKAPIPGPIIGHVGDGNFHAELLFYEDRPDEVRAAKALADRMVERALRLGGTATCEHGIGAGKRGFMAAEHGAAWSVMGAIKTALDPGDILNPGKLVPPR